MENAIRWRRLVAVFSLAVCGTVRTGWAHPGHGVTPSEMPTHYLVEPQHGLWVVGATLATAGLFLLHRYLSQPQRQVLCVKRHSED